MFKPIAVALGIAILGFTPSMAHAQPDDEVYPPEESITVEATATSCTVPNEPTVTYSVAPVGFVPDPGESATITLFDVNNNQIGAPFTGELTGSFLYPGTTFDASGEVVTWPGWVYENGVWVETQSASTIWRQGITVQFDVNPSTSVSVAYPDDDPNCDESATIPPPGDSSTSGSLPTTGSNSTSTLLQIGSLLLLAGGLIAVTTHRRRSSAPA